MQRATEQPHSKYAHVYAIVRFDLFAGLSKLEDCVTVVKVLASQDLAEQEAARLREANKGKNCTYVVQITRFVPTPLTSTS